ncbi:MAG TPA: alpha/beta hydrolase [Stellaceae bacterium]|nr:alpha/beta hydrolase [Stellaceae bacterium]
MQTATIRGAKIVYDVLGKSGPWYALSPGGRRSGEEVRSLAQRTADAGFRVLIYDRRNCGASDVVLEGNESEYEIWADDLYELLKQLNALPAYIGGASSGCRLSVLFALRHPDAVKGLLLTRITGGAFACNRLAENYYGQYMKAAEQGGMAAVCATEHWAERIKANPSNRDRIMAMDPKRFIAAFGRWREPFSTGASLPMIGVTEADLRSIKVPTMVIPGHDRTHNLATGTRAAKLIPGAEFHNVMGEDVDADLAAEAWEEKEGELASLFIDFMRRAERKHAA